MVDGVKGLSCIQKKKKTLNSFENTLKEIIINIDRVVHTVLAPQKALLRRMNKGRNSGHDGVAMVEARMRLSVLVTEMGRVSEIRPVCFLGMRKRRP